jgi:hypothetical protein
MKTVMKDYSKRKDCRYVVWDSAFRMTPFGGARSWHPSLKAALAAHPDAKPAQGCLRADGTRKVLK